MLFAKLFEGIVFEVTFKCTVQCDFCSLDCSPDKTDYLDSTFMIGIIQQVMHHKKPRYVSFTGGEPFLFLEEIETVLSFLKAMKIFTTIVTSGFWAKDYKMTFELLSHMKEKGLTGLCVSVDDFHQKLIPLEYIRNIYQVARELGISCLIKLKEFHGITKINKRYLERFLGVKFDVVNDNNMHFFHKLYDSFTKKRKRAILHGVNEIEINPTLPIGRGSACIEEWQPKGHPRIYKKPCRNILRALIVNPYKELMACCGPLKISPPILTIGSIKEDDLFSLILKAGFDPVLRWINQKGPYDLLKRIGEIKGRAPQKSYVNPCHICYDLLYNDENLNILYEYQRTMMNFTFSSITSKHAKYHFDNILQP